MTSKPKRDDFTWLLLLFEQNKNRRQVPLRTGQSYYNNPNTFSQGFRFSDERRAEMDQEEMRKRMRRAKIQGIAYLVVMVAISLILALFLH